MTGTATDAEGGLKLLHLARAVAWARSHQGVGMD